MRRQFLAWFLSSMICGGWAHAVPQDNVSEDPEASDQSDSDRRKIPHVDIHIVPVGPIPLAQFGIRKSEPEELADKEQVSEKKEDSGNEKQQAVPSGPDGFVVLNRDAREYPPKALYLRQGDKFAMIPCAQNSIGTSVRVPLTQSEMIFYQRIQAEDGSITYKKYYTHAWKPSQKRLLFTITKPLGSKYWTQFTIKPYDISPRRLNGKSISIVNAGAERTLGLLVNGHAKALRPHGTTALGFPKEKDGVVIKFGAFDKNGKVHAPMNLSVRNKQGEHLLVLAFPCDPKESFRGVKAVRGRIVDDKFRMASFRKKE